MVKIYLSITSDTGLQAAIQEDYPYLLFSYWYIKKGLKPFQHKKTWKKTMIDSGAHSIQQGAKTNYDKFFQEYYHYLQKHKKHIDYAVELDIEEKVGLKKVEEWRKQLETLNIPIIVVWHKQRGWHYWEKMCKKYDYIGISGFLKPGTPEIPDKYLPKFLKTAQQHNTKVHGFGYTRLKNPNIQKFHSIDSSSWSAFVRWPNRPILPSIKHKPDIPKHAYKQQKTNTLHRHKLGIRYYKQLQERWEK